MSGSTTPAMKIAHLYMCIQQRLGRVNLNFNMQEMKGLHSVTNILDLATGTSNNRIKNVDEWIDGMQKKYDSSCGASVQCCDYLTYVRQINAFDDLFTIVEEYNQLRGSHHELTGTYGLIVFTKPVGKISQGSYHAQLNACYDGALNARTYYDENIN